MLICADQERKVKKKCRTEILQMSICSDEQGKVKVKKLKYCKREYAETRKPK